METDVMTTTETAAPKLTKVERLKKSLEAARARLAAREPALLVELAKADAELKRLRQAYDSARERSQQIYQAHATALREEAVKLGLTDKSGCASDKLLADLTTFATANGLPTADVVTVSRDVIARELAKVPALQALKEEQHRASKEADKAHRAWNIASCPTGAVYRLNHELRQLREAVEKLETEIKRVPVRNQTARDKRAEEREEALRFQATEELRKRLEGFTFNAETEVSK